MRRFVRHLVVALLFCSLTACSSARHLQQPILERGGHAVPAGDSTAAQDLKACPTQVREAAPVRMHPRWLPPLGAVGSGTGGVVLERVDVPHPVWPSREAYRQAIERCLTANGDEIRSWQ